MQRAVGYVRVSSKEQGEGFSPNSQEEDIRGWAEENGVVLLKVFRDIGEKSDTDVRPGLDALRSYITQEPVDYVVVWRRDRLARESTLMYTLEYQFERAGAKVVSVEEGDLGDTPEAALLKHIMDGVAEFEHKLIRSRTVRNKLQRAKSGLIVPGGRGPVYGYDYSSDRTTYVVKEEEMRVVRRILREAAEGRSLRGIAHGLERDGIPPRRSGKHWKPEHVRQVILKDMYRPHTYEELKEILSPDILATRVDPEKTYGVYYYNVHSLRRRKEREETPQGVRYRYRTYINVRPREEWVGVPVPHSGVPAEVIDEARSRLKGVKPHIRRWSRVYELGGMAVCSRCGASLSATSCSPKKKVKGQVYSYAYAYYVCSQCAEARAAMRARGGELFKVPRARADKLEGEVWERVKGLLLSPEILADAIERVRKKLLLPHTHDDSSERALLKRLDELEEERRRSQEMTRRGLMTFEELEEALAQLKEEQEKVKKALAKERSALKAARELSQRKEELLSSLPTLAPSILENSTPQQRRSLYEKLSLKVYVAAGGKVESVRGVFGDLSEVSITPSRKQHNTKPPAVEFSLLPGGELELEVYYAA